ncbi:MAG TPA: citryl-CoA lyase [Casimicrobiaceae bacterium]|nr:citryl-CoA lyase [Casimicrobiaceae bacterium]
MSKRAAIRTALGWSTPERIVVRGLDLPTEIIGRLNLGDMAFLELTGRVPTPAESAVFNAIAVTLVEHGITPSALAARLTLLGAPEAMQAAVGAGLCGLGSVFMGSTYGAARMLLKAGSTGPVQDVARIAAEVVAAYRSEGRTVPGIGHPLHKDGDPRVEALFGVAEAHGYSGRHVALMRAIAAEAERVHARKLPINATGAIAAIACELGLSATMCHGIAVMARAIGLVAHCAEEMETPIAARCGLKRKRKPRETPLPRARCRERCIHSKPNIQSGIPS